MDDSQTLDCFHNRIDVLTAETLFREARASGLLSPDEKSFLVHDLARMKDRIRMLYAAFGPSTMHAVAIKANPLVEVLRVAVESGAGLEAASIEEVQLALAADCPPEKIVFDSPAKTMDEIRQALERGLTINANGWDELERIDECWRETESASSIGLRINPELGQGAIALTSVADQGSKFGVSLRNAKERILAAFDRYVWLSGLHVHVGSQGCRLEMLVQAIRNINRLRHEVERARGENLRFVDIGGGLPAIYETDASSPSPQEYADEIRTAEPSLLDGSTQVITEFGRSVQAGCGVTFTQVEYVRPEQAMIVVHLGADFLMRPVYAAKDWRHEFAVLSRQGFLKTAPTRPTQIAGPLCFAGDILGRDVMLPEISPGDWLVIRDTGAYTLSMWSRHCSRGIPIVLGSDGAADPAMRVLRAAETPQTVVGYWGRNGSSSA